jgi:tetratricopeptide (TPR) repeat protein
MLSLTKAEAAYRLGDLYMVRFQYEEAIASYSIALRDYPSEAHSFPSFFINRGEALYQLGQFEIAKQVFHEVIDHYAGLPEGWRATFRLGEIVAKGTLDPEKIKESRSWFYDTINRYPLSPGATLARIRLLPCGDHAGMDSYASENFFTNVAVNFDGGGAVVLKDYNDFRALAHIRTLATLGPEEQLGKVAFQELQNVKSPLARKKIILVATESVQRKIMKLISEGKQYDALSFYTLMSPLIDKDVESERVDYLLALSQSASNLGLGAFGEKLLKIYQDKLEHLKRRPNRVLAQAPLPDNQDDLELEIKQAEEYFSAAKAGWIVGSKDQAGLALIREKLSHISAESKYFYEKEIILGLIEERQGNLKAALVHAASAHLQKPSVRVTAWLASLAKSVADTKDALELYKIVENCLLDSKGHELINEPIESNLGVPPVPHLVDVVFLEGELLEKNEKWAEASAKYSQAMSSGLGGNQLVFRYAWSLIKGGEAGAKEKALEVLEKLSTSETKNDKEEFWKKMALTTLEGEKSKAKVD